MAKIAKEKPLFKVKGELIVDVIAEMIAAKKLEDLKELVAEQKLIVRIDAKTIALLKKHLRSEIKKADKVVLIAAARAENSTEPCERD